MGSGSSFGRVGIALAVVLFSGCSGGTLAGTDLGRLGEMNPADFESLDKGTYSEFGNEEFVGQVANDSAALQALWKRHQGSGQGRVAPKVDLSQEFAVGLFLGQKPTGGYVFGVVTVVHEDGRFIVAYQATEPGAGCATTQAFTNPFEFVAVGRVGDGPPTVAYERVGPASRTCA